MKSDVLLILNYQAAGTAPASFCSTLLESKELTTEEEFDLKWSAASIYSGGHFLGTYFTPSCQRQSFDGRRCRYCKHLGYLVSKRTQILLRRPSPRYTPFSWP